MSSSCLIIAGEKSGEDHARSFFADLKSSCPDTKFYGVGGEYLKQNDVELIYHLKDFSSWGISEVVGKIPFYKNALNELTTLARERKTQTAILIDFQDFNLRLAKRLSKQGVNVLYYVAPQAWAWRPWRAATLGKCVHTLFTILPFEKEWFKSRGVKKIIGIVHPLVIEYGPRLERNKLGIEAKPYYKNLDRPLKIVLLPGSRNFEVGNLLPHYLEAIKILNQKYNIEVSIVKSSSVRKEIFELNQYGYQKVYDDTQLAEALTDADIAIAASGTVTLTCAIFELPTVVCYQASLLTEMFGDIFMIYNGPVSLGNIVHNKMLYPEMIQTEVYAQNIVNKLSRWIEDEAQYNYIKAELSKTIDRIQGDDVNIPKYMADVINGVDNA